MAAAAGSAGALGVEERPASWAGSAGGSGLCALLAEWAVDQLGRRRVSVFSSTSRVSASSSQASQSALGLSGGGG